MNKRITSSIIAALMIAGSTSITTFAAMGSGSVVIGNKAFDLTYANNQANANEISSAITAGGEVYIKDFEGNWKNNISESIINANIIPAVTYTNDDGTSNFDAGDKDHMAIITVQSVSSIANKNVIYGANAANVGLPTTVTLKLSDNTTKDVSVTWTSSTYDGTKTATYIFTGVYALPSGVTGTKPSVKVNVVVGVKPNATDIASAKAVDTKIIALPALSALTLANKTGVVAVRNAYASITSAQKLLVTKLSTLVAAEGKIADLQANADEKIAEAAEEKAVSIAEKSKMNVDVTKANGLIQSVKNATKQAEFSERISNINILDEIVSKGNNTFKLTPYNISLDDFISKEMGNTPAASISGKWLYAATKDGKLGYTSEGNKTWVNSPTSYNSIKSQLTSNINPINLENDPVKIYQFVELNYSDCVSADTLNTMFGENNALSGKGQVFIDAAQKSDVNPLYLAGHSILETGHGTSLLANGGTKKATGEYTYGMPVYNLFGIGAIDSDANAAGTSTAFKNTWTDIDSAIYGGAAFISGKYISKGQNTIYKMRWNNLDVNHQYATDVSWANSQTKIIKQYFDLCPEAKLTFDIPVYK
ncbi:glucosaminidase domain-containing protein [Clostridium estertheticum]|uniref:glucosaminidase domain-containing protein n=1 Tax=Clostridium estertheticum TaxID=238834 RepID=UPI00124D2DBE|nr:glucosaminidase domain-containing protein [Clostridium estertheticum]MBZ9616127.1 glucosaminidase domain-containing protein [Clostridium estertheticum subsp. laramiense]WAG71876.1 glucosaminidase domain-containing protein [Clostridium estertheticum]